MNFKIKNKFNKEKIIIWSIVIFIALIAFGNFIATSWFDYDLKASKLFYKGMDIDIIRGWASYMVFDGYVGIVTFSLIFGFILIESLFRWRRNSNSTGGGSNNHNKIINYIFLFICIVWSVMLGLVLNMQLFKDHGFGRMFNEGLIVDKRYIIPIFCVSYIVNFSILWTSAWYIRFKLGKKQRFLELKLWKKSLTILLFILVCYLPVIIFKAGMGRPYYFNMIWDKTMEEVKVKYPEQYNHYINQTEFNYGWISFDENGNRLYGEEYLTKGFDEEWPWWKAAKGTFSKADYKRNLPIEKAFPSGHMAATFTICLTMYLFTGVNSKSKKFNTIKWVGLTLALLYTFSMAFGLEVSLNHWLSDITFTMSWGPIAFIISNVIVDKSLKGIQNKIMAKKHS